MTETAEGVTISIHVLRVEDDNRRPNGYYHFADFNPRPPCGGRRYAECSSHTSSLFQSTSSVWRTTIFGTAFILDFVFQSTSSVWRTTSWRLRSRAGSRISIHVLRVEDDLTGNLSCNVPRDFNPRPPCGGRHLRHGQAS